jgi:hypothetical protein
VPVKIHLDSPPGFSGASSQRRRNSRAFSEWWR